MSVKSAARLSARTYLQTHGSRLEQLRSRYQASQAIVRASEWSADYIASEVDLLDFRADKAYVWQARDSNTERNYLLTYDYLKSIDRLGLLDTLAEDDAFGAQVIAHPDGTVLSRDLLDSIVEIYALDRLLGISGWQGGAVLDIGAGYGRLAHRMARALPNLKQIYCTDAIAESTFICEYYLRFRAVDARVIVVPLDQIEQTLARHPIELAVNIHCFSECSLASIAWWVDLLVKYRVPNLLIVPNPDRHLGTQLLSHEGYLSIRFDFLHLLTSRGYHLVALVEKYPQAAGMMKDGVSPTHHHLFRLQG